MGGQDCVPGVLSHSFCISVLYEAKQSGAVFTGAVAVKQVAAAVAHQSATQRPQTRFRVRT
jgi:hypothetical protein